jgi:TIR domain
MSEVFISYAREDRPLAESLANELQQKGFAVWWDAELVGSDNFQDVILAALARAKAAIVIWTKNSVTSNFVRDEARYALFHNKLIATKAGELNVIDIPFGFQSQHTENVLNRSNILRAIQKLGVRPTTTTAPSDTWEQVRNSQDTTKILAWIGENPTHPSHSEAVALVQNLFEHGRGAEAIPTASEPVVRRSRLEALFRGLTFQLPRFQLAEEGKWSSIGLTITLLAVFLSAAYIWVTALFSPNISFYETVLRLALRSAFLALAIHTALSGVLSYYAIHRWIAQRNFQAAVIAAPAFILSTTGTLFVFAGGIIFELFQLKNYIGLTIFGATLIGGAAWSYLYLRRRFRQAR